MDEIQTTGLKLEEQLTALQKANIELQNKYDKVILEMETLKGKNIFF